MSLKLIKASSHLVIKKLDAILYLISKMGKNFRRKARMVARDHTTETPAALTYASVFSRDSVRIACNLAALNDLKSWRVIFRMHTSLTNAGRRSGTL